jgi:hypothetical protein
LARLVAPFSVAILAMIPTLIPTLIPTAILTSINMIIGATATTIITCVGSVTALVESSIDLVAFAIKTVGELVATGRGGPI